VTYQVIDQKLPAPPKNATPLETESITRLYAKIAIPIAFGMVLSGLYNIIDAFFIAQFVGAEAFAAVSAIFPLQMLIIAIGALISNGVSIIVSQYWGAKKYDEARKVLDNAFTLILLLAIVLAIPIFGYTSQILNAISVTELLFVDAKAYFVPITLGAIFVLSLSLICDLLRAQTNMQGLLLIILFGTIANIFLDYLFIVVADMGTRGAAFATLLGQLMAIILGLKILSADKSSLKISKLRLTLNIDVIIRFLSLGLPVFISYLGASIIMLLINSSIAHHALIDPEQFIAAYGIISRINIFLILPLIAISYASQTIIAHNFGANIAHRVKKTAITGVVIATCYLCVVALCLYLLPRQIIGIFSQQESLISQTQSIAEIMFLMLPFSGISAICIAFFQATGRAKLALTLSITQVYVFLLPGILLILNMFDLSKIWYAFPLTQCLSILLTAALLWTQKHTFKFSPLACQD
jgi:putative MATE family efflux protein